MNALITGPTSGVGRALAFALAGEGYNLLLLVRDPAKGRALAGELAALFPAVQTDVIPADLADLASVRAAVTAIRNRYKRLDRLFNNAGYAPARYETVYGYEKSFVTNHLGHFVLTTGLLDLLEASGDGRVIQVASDAHILGNVRRFFGKTRRWVWGAYADGKLANMLFARELARRYADRRILAFSFHPGFVNTAFAGKLGPFWRLMMRSMSFLMITPEKAAQTGLYLSSAPAGLLSRFSGWYFVRSRPARVLNSGFSDGQAGLLWKKSEEAVAAILPA